MAAQSRVFIRQCNAGCKRYSNVRIQKIPIKKSFFYINPLHAGDLKKKIIWREFNSVYTCECLIICIYFECVQSYPQLILFYVISTKIIKPLCRLKSKPHTDSETPYTQKAFRPRTSGHVKYRPRKVPATYNTDCSTGRRKTTSNLMAESTYNKDVWIFARIHSHALV